jgi:hypothetical protein
MMVRISLPVALVCACLLPFSTLAQENPIEISADGKETVVLTPTPTDEKVIRGRSFVPYGSAPNWQNTLRMQVGGLQVADMNGDEWPDVVVGCYQSNSFPPYPDWENLIYFNNGGELEADPSWISADEVSTGDIQVALINDDPYPDVFAANGGSSMAPSVIYWGGPDGPSLSPGWYSSEPGGAWNNYALPFDFDHDGDMDVVTANQGNSQFDPYRPLFIFLNTDGVLANVPVWQSAETSIQNFLAFADHDGDGWEDLAVSKWVNFESGIYRNLAGAMATTPVWTTGDDDSDKGVAWADVDGNDWPDLVLGHDPTQLWSNNAGAMAMTWTSAASYHGHSDMRFCDVDLDGDQDLAETHFSDGKVHIYLNQAGTLDSVPSWTYDSSSVGTAIAFGLINGDQWPDLVVGNSGEPCVKVFYAEPVAAIDQDETPGPVVSDLRCFPNPFNPETMIRFRLEASAQVNLQVFNARGEKVRTLLQGPMSAGEQAVPWHGRDDHGQLVNSGVYFYRLETESSIKTGQMALVR